MCEYCKSKNPIDIAKDDFGMNKDGNTISSIVIGEYGGLDTYINDTLVLSANIRYCPMCGRKLNTD